MRKPEFYDDLKEYKKRNELILHSDVVGNLIKPKLHFYTL